MTLERLEIRTRTPYEPDESFGDTGAYERIDAVAHYAVDPGHPALAGWFAPLALRPSYQATLPGE